ncbi:MAG: hypothetical protein GWN01_01275 [Nitrosopumilaceae archaeon]|nr:hypothetical protein [Nitrosopumilaceae archaeon]NIU85991.1 hypothetical protein [Nitrosopumilaceae archaeon]NIX60210.1 hypothetical protein [Nitrosopumilaceae archaeon]
MPEDDATVSKEVNLSDDNSSFLETALRVIKWGVGTTGSVWVASGVGKVAIDLAYAGSVDTTFLEQAFTTMTPVFTGFVTTLIGWFIRDQGGKSKN